MYAFIYLLGFVTFLLVVALFIVKEEDRSDRRRQIEFERKQTDERLARDREFENSYIDRRV